MSGAAPSDSGIVLVELLAALSIVAIMSAMMAGILGQMRTVAGMGDAVATRGQMAAAVDHVTRTVAGARPIPLRVAGEAAAASNAPVFLGTEDALRFVAVTRRGFGTLGLSEVTLALRRGGDGLALVQTLRAMTGSQVADVTVIEGLTAGSFVYLEEDGAPVATWSGTDLPLGVRIALTGGTPARPVEVRGFAGFD